MHHRLLRTPTRRAPSHQRRYASLSMNYCTQDEHLRRKYAPIFRCHRICSHIAYAVLNPNPELTAHFPVWDHDPQRLSAVLDVNRHGEFATGQVARFFGRCLRCNSLEWNGHCAPQHLTLHSACTPETAHFILSNRQGYKRSGKASPCIRYATGIAGRERKMMLGDCIGVQHAELL